ENAHPCRVPIGIQRRLGEAEIEVRSLTREDQLRRQEMVAFVPREGASLRIDQERHRVEQQEQTGNAPRRAGLFRIAGKLRHWQIMTRVAFPSAREDPDDVAVASAPEGPVSESGRLYRGRRAPGAGPPSLEGA